MIERLESRRMLASTTDIRIDAGGGSYTDASGHLWQADTFYRGGQSVSWAFAPQHTSDPSLLVTRREGGSFHYLVPLANGYYTVTLLEAEPYFTQYNQRVFNVYAQNQMMIDGWDLAGSVGKKMATEQSFQVNVTNGSLDLKFAGVKDEAIVSAIHIFSIAPPPQLPDAPSRFAASWNSSGQVILNWEDNAPEATGYIIQRSTDGGGYSTIYKGDGDFTDAYLDANAAPGHTYAYRLRLTNGTESSAPIVARVSTTKPGGPVPFSGKPVTLPATIQSENFDAGGNGISYSDSDIQDDGDYSSAPWLGHDRTTPVDMQPLWSIPDDYAISWTEPGEWLDYTVSISTAGKYDLTTRFANPALNTSIHYELDGKRITPEIDLPVTADFDTYTSITNVTSSLPVGVHVIRIVMDTAGDDGFAGNYDSITLQPKKVANPAALTSATVAQPNLFNTPTPPTKNSLDDLL